MTFISRHRPAKIIEIKCRKKKIRHAEKDERIKNN